MNLESNALFSTTRQQAPKECPRGHLPWQNDKPSVLTNHFIATLWAIFATLQSNNVWHSALNTHLCLLEKVPTIIKSNRMCVKRSKAFILHHKQVILLLIGLAMSACNTKSPAVPSDTSTALPQKEAEHQIMSVSYGTDPDAEKWFVYNSEGDFVSHAVSIDTVVYTYYGQKFEKRHVNRTHSWQSKVVYTLDGRGKISYSTSYDEKGQEISTFGYRYDSIGHLQQTMEKVMQSQSTCLNTFDYIDGNLARVTVRNNGRITSHYNFAYYTDLKNDLNLFLQQIAEDIFPNERMGRKNRNFVKQMTNVSADGDTLSLLQCNYQISDNPDELVVVEKDVLNEMETTLTYHFKTKKQQK